MTIDSLKDFTHFIKLTCTNHAMNLHCTMLVLSYIEFIRMDRLPHHNRITLFNFCAKSRSYITSLLFTVQSRSGLSQSVCSMIINNYSC